MAIPWETVHIFISSTFNDLHAERDYLVKQVFPHLREWCERRKLRLVDVDLRWGVTEQDAHSQNVVKVCLDRIDECRPFFLCFLGQRRGWAPRVEDISAETLAQFPALGEHAGSASVTELEILHALLSPFQPAGRRPPGAHEPICSPDPAKYAFFYLREPDYLASLPDDPPELRQAYTNAAVSEPAARLEQDRLLQHWRAVIIPAAGRPVCHYRARWDPTLSTPELRLPLKCPSSQESSIRRWQAQWRTALGESVTGVDLEADPRQAGLARSYNRRLSAGRLADFQAGGQPLSAVILAGLQHAITERFPEHVEIVSEPGLQMELDQQEQYLAAAREGFIAREGDFEALDAYVEDDARQLFVLTGAGGLGKSTLLARWVERWRAKLAARPGESLHFRFIGQSDQSGRVTPLLYWLLHEIKQNAGKLQEDIPQDALELRRAFSKTLASAAKSGKTVVVLDGLNQLESGLSDLAWLPYQLPEGVKLIVSFKDGEPAGEQTLAHMQGKVIRARVRPFTDLSHRRMLVKAYLDLYLKQLDEPLLDALVNAPGAANPLYLKVVLSELRVFGAYANLLEKIQSEFGDTPAAAFGAVLRRLENDPPTSGLNPKQVVPLLFGFLAYARQGLSIDELQALLQREMQNGPVDARPADISGAIHVCLRQVRLFTASRSGRMDFFYESMRAAVQARYTTGAAAGAAPVESEGVARRSPQAWHSLLAGYFETLPTWRGDFRARRRSPVLRRVELLPYHLAHAGQSERLARLLCDPQFLEAKCEAGLVGELLEEYRSGLAEFQAAWSQPERQEIETYAALIRRHSQNLAHSLGLLPALIIREGSAQAAATVNALSAQGIWTAPWLRTDEIAITRPKPPAHSQAGVEIRARWTFDRPHRLASLAAGQRLVFYQQGRGQIGAVDLDDGALLGPIEVPSAGASPLLGLHASPNGRFVAILLQYAADLPLGLLYQLDFDSHRKLRGAQPVFSFDYLLPEYEAPVIGLSNTELLYQDAKGMLQRTGLAPGVTACEQVYSPPGAPAGWELSAVVFNGSQGLLAFRQGGKTYLVVVGEGQAPVVVAAIPSDLSSACQAGPDSYATAGIDGKIYFCSRSGLTGAPLGTPGDEPALKMMAHQGWLYWLTRLGNLYRAELNQEQAGSTATEAAAAPACQPEAVAVGGDPSLFQSALQFDLCPPDGFWILTPRAANQCQASSTAAAPLNHPIAALAVHDRGSARAALVAIENRPDSLWVYNVTDRAGALLIHDAEDQFLHRYRFSSDGDGNLLGVGIASTGVTANPIRRQAARLVRLPETVASLAGAPQGGFWLAGKSGRLYFLDPHGQAELKATLDLRLAGEPGVYCWPGLLVVTSSGLDGADYAGELAFYTPTDRAAPNVTLIGKRRYQSWHVQALAYDHLRGRLYAVYSQQGHQAIACGTPEQWIAYRETTRVIPAMPEEAEAACLAPDGDSLLLLSKTGKLYLFDTREYDLQASLSGSAPVSSLAGETGPDGRFIVVDEQMNLFTCEIEGGIS